MTAADDQRCARARKLQAIDDAFRAGDLAALRAAVDDPSAIPNGSLDDTIGTCLVYAIYHSPLAFIRELLDLGADPNALVILGTRGKRDRLIAQFEAYCQLVPVQSFVVIEFTTLNGFPIDSTFGPGPHEALRRIMNVHGEFVAEAWREHPPTFNHAGLLRRKS